MAIRCRHVYFLADIRADAGLDGPALHGSMISIFTAAFLKMARDISAKRAWAYSRYDWRQTFYDMPPKMLFGRRAAGHFIYGAARMGDDCVTRACASANEIFSGKISGRDAARAGAPAGMPPRAGFDPAIASPRRRLDTRRRRLYDATPARIYGQHTTWRLVSAFFLSRWASSRLSQDCRLACGCRWLWYLKRLAPPMQHGAISPFDGRQLLAGARPRRRV